MISPHSNNKEVIKKKICYPMRYMVITVSYWSYYTQQLIYLYHLHKPLFMIIPYHIIFIVHIQLWGHIMSLSWVPHLIFVSVSHILPSSTVKLQTDTFSSFYYKMKAMSSSIWLTFSFISFLIFLYHITVEYSKVCVHCLLLAGPQLFMFWWAVTIN